MYNPYYNKHIKPFIRGLCRDHLDAYDGKRELQLSDLDKDDINKFVMHMYDLDDRQLQVHDMENAEAVTTNAVIMLKSSDPEDKAIFADSWIDGAYGYYKAQMAELLEEEFELEKQEHENERALSYKEI